MVQLGGLEPPTSWSTAKRSNQLSYSCTIIENGRNLIRFAIGWKKIRFDLRRPVKSEPAELALPAPNPQSRKLKARTIRGPSLAGHFGRGSHGSGSFEHLAQAFLHRLSGVDGDFLRDCSQLFGLSRDGFILLARLCRRKFHHFRQRLDRHQLRCEVER